MNRRLLILIVLTFVASALCTSFTINIPTDSDSLKFSKEKQYIDQQIVKINQEQVLSNDSILGKIYKLNKLSDEIEYSKGLAETNFLIGCFYDIKSIGDSAIKYYNKGLYYGEAINYDKYIKLYSEKIAETLWQTGQYFEGINFTQSVIDYYEKIGYQERLFYLNDVLALLYRDIGDTEKALETFNISYNYSLKYNQLAFASTTLTNIGAIYFHHKKYNKALEYYLKGVKGEEEYGHIAYAGRSYVSIALIYLELNDETKAEEYLKKALQYNKKTNDLIGFSRTFKAYGKLHIFQSNYKDAIQCLQKAKNLAETQGKNLTLAEIYQDLSDTYKLINKTDSAYYYLDKYLKITQELVNFDKLSQLKRIEYQLKVEKDNNKIQQLKIDKQKTQNNLLIVIFILVLVISILFVTLYFQSIKSKKRLEKINQDLKKARIKAEESDQLKSHFLRNISHEIRTPLNGIIGFSEMILKHELSKPELEEINYFVQKNSDELLSTINNMVDVAHLESNQFHINLSVFNVRDVLNNVITAIKNIPDYSKKKLKIEVKAAREVKLNSDPEILHKILFQLLKNAVLFSNQGIISIEFYEEDSHIQFVIKDNGEGIAQEKLNLIFSAFQRGNEINVNQRGNGLGLTMVAHLIKLLQGDISVESELEKGSTFYFTIPNNE